MWVVLVALFFGGGKKQKVHILISDLVPQTPLVLYVFNTQNKIALVCQTAFRAILFWVLNTYSTRAIPQKKHLKCDDDDDEGKFLGKRRFLGCLIIRNPNPKYENGF